MKTYILATTKDLQRELAQIRTEFHDRDIDPYWMTTYREARQYLLTCLTNFRRLAYDPSA